MKSGISRQREVFDLVKHLTGQPNVLTIPRAFIAYTGSLEAALLLSQIIYWSDRTSNPQGWFWKSYREWEEELSLSKHKVNTAVNQIKSKGFLKTRVRKANGTPTLHYKLDANAFIASISVFLTMESEKPSLSSNRDYSSGKRKTPIRSIKQFQQDRNSPYSTPAEEDQKRRAEIQGSR